MSLMIRSGNVTTPSSPFAIMPMNSTNEQNDYEVTGATGEDTSFEKANSNIPTSTNPTEGVPTLELVEEPGADANLVATHDTPLQLTTHVNTKEDPQYKPLPVESAHNVLTINSTAVNSNLPMRKRKQSNTDDNVEESINPETIDHKKIKVELNEVEADSVIATELADALALSGGKPKPTSLESDEDHPLSPAALPSPTAATTITTTPNGTAISIQRMPMSKAREIRLEQNRKAARESRRRKKIMIEELQRSVIFFSRANGTLKQRNDELERLLLQAKAQVQAFESGKHEAAAAAAAKQDTEEDIDRVTDEQENEKEDISTKIEPTETPHQQQQQQQQQQQDPSDVTAANMPNQPEMQDQQEAQCKPQPHIQQLHQLQHQQIQQQGMQCNESLQTRDESQQAQAQQAVACAQAQQQAQAHAARAAVTQAMFESHGFPPTAARAAAQNFVAGAPPPHVAQPQAQAPPQQQPTVDTSGNVGSNAPHVSQIQPAQTQQIPMQQIAMQQNNGGSNPWPFIMAMQQPPPLAGTTPATAALGNGTGQVQTQTGQSLQDTFMAMQHYNAAACNPLMIQPMPVPNPTSAVMFGQQNGIIMPPPQQQEQQQVQVQSMVIPSPQQHPEQEQVPNIVCENPHQGNVDEVMNIPIVDGGLVESIGAEAAGNL